MSDWQKIDTAPKNGAFIVCNDIGEVCSCQARDGFVIVHNVPGHADWTYGNTATNWMPLPASPEAQS